jgi:hypothetical protein
MTGATRPTEASAHLPAEATSAGAARRFLTSTLTDWDLEPLEEVGTLLVSELVSNALLHAGTEIDVHLRHRDGRLRVEVHDRSARLPERKHYSPTSVTGRGLVFVAELSEAWGAERTPQGKSVWFELDDSSTPVAPHPAIGAEFSLDDWEDWDDLATSAVKEAAGPGPRGGSGGHRKASSRCLVDA